MSEPLRVVAIGGGTGLSSLLAGLKRFPATEVDITAVVTVTDDGGSSGRLRRDFDVLPPGDIRNCMVALCEDEHLLAQLFRYRFQAGQGLKGHSFGNLFLTALTYITGDFADAVRKSCEVLNIAGRIFPSTRTDVSLEAVLADGTVVAGESRISSSVIPIREIRIVPAHPKPMRETLRAIEHADLITLGPGSLFTSVIPNLLVSGIPKAIRNSSALKVYFVNLMSQPGETTSFRASDHVEALHRHAKSALIDCVVVNSSRMSRVMLQRYARQHAAPVENDHAALRAMGLEIIEADLLQRAAKVRHNPLVIGSVAFDLALKGRHRRLAKLKSNGE